MKQGMQESYEKGVANRSAPSFALRTAKMDPESRQRRKLQARPDSGLEATIASCSLKTPNCPRTWFARSIPKREMRSAAWTAALSGTSIQQCRVPLAALSMYWLCTTAKKMGIRSFQRPTISRYRFRHTLVHPFASDKGEAPIFQIPYLDRCVEERAAFFCHEPRLQLPRVFRSGNTRFTQFVHHFLYRIVIPLPASCAGIALEDQGTDIVWCVGK